MIIDWKICKSYALIVIHKAQLIKEENIKMLKSQNLLIEKSMNVFAIFVVKNLTLIENVDFALENVI